MLHKRKGGRNDMAQLSPGAADEEQEGGGKRRREGGKRRRLIVCLQSKEIGRRRGRLCFLFSSAGGKRATRCAPSTLGVRANRMMMIIANEYIHQQHPESTRVFLRLLAMFGIWEALVKGRRRGECVPGANQFRGTVARSFSDATLQVRSCVTNCVFVFTLRA